MAVCAPKDHISCHFLLESSEKSLPGLIKMEKITSPASQLHKYVKIAPAEGVCLLQCIQGTRRTLARDPSTKEVYSLRAEGQVWQC